MTVRFDNFLKISRIVSGLFIIMHQKRPEGKYLVITDEKQRKSTDGWMKRRFSGIMFPFLNIRGKEDHHVL